MQPTWVRVLSEIDGLRKTNSAALDVVRRRKFEEVERITKRPAVFYGTAWTSPGKNIPQELLLIDFSDKTGFREVTEQLEGTVLDVIIHSPGGLADAAQALVEIIRDRFKDVRFIIPHSAKSAATMLGLSGNLLLMDEVSELGPIDPQMPIFQGGGVKYSPADAILSQFEKAHQDVKDHPERLSIWVPILAQMGPSLLVECENAKQLSKKLVREWLIAYMFNGEPDAEDKATYISSYLADHINFLSHSKRIDITEAKKIGLKVQDLRSDLKLREAVWELYCSIDIAFANSTAVKIIANSKGHAIFKHHGDMVVRMPQS